VVFVVERGRVHRRSPRLGVRDMVRVEVIEGISEGEQVVVSGAHALDEGTRVKTTVAPPFDGVIPSKTTRAKMSL
jgi:hypothetical protein